MCEKTIKKITACIKELEGNITLGIDGYVDEVWRVVQARANLSEFTLYRNMKALGEAIVKCGDGGFAQEVIKTRRSYGGFTGNTGNALGCLGIKPVMLGMYGKDSIDSVFERFHTLCDLISLGDPATCLIFEFEDGKLMYPCMEALLGFNWEVMHDYAGFNRVEEILLNSEIIALGYWSSMPAFDEVVTKVCESYVEKGRCQKMFFDFADFRKRDRSSLERTLKVLAKLNEIVPMTLSLNENEAELLFSYHSEEFDERHLERALINLRKKIGISEIVVHTPHIAASSHDKEGFAEAQNRYCPNPVITAGAGDTFNGGYLAASLGMLDIQERLITANATTAFYVRNGYAPGTNELIAELESFHPSAS